MRPRIRLTHRRAPAGGRQRVVAAAEGTRSVLASDLGCPPASSPRAGRVRRVRTFGQLRIVSDYLARFTHLGAVQLYSTLLAIRTLLHLSSFGQATSFVALVHFDELHEVTWQERS